MPEPSNTRDPLASETVMNPRSVPTSILHHPTGKTLRKSPGMVSGAYKMHRGDWDGWSVDLSGET